MLALLLSAVLLVQPDTTQARPDTTDTPPPIEIPDFRPVPQLPNLPQPEADTTASRVKIRPRLAPTALYSGSRGFGIAGGVGVRNAVLDGSDVTLDLRLSQRYQSVELAAFTADPYEAKVYGLASVEASTTTRQRYYGIGPGTTKENRLFLDYASVSAEGRLGVYPLGHTGLFLQPGARFLLDRLRDVEDDQPGALDRLRETDPTSAAAVESDAILDETRYGFSLGLEVASDLRDWRGYPRRGTFVSAEFRRFYALDGSDLRFNRISGTSLGYLPIRGRTALVGRSTVVLTRADDGMELPFYYLPVLDARLLTAYPTDRFMGRDALALGGGIRFPVADFIGVYGVDMLVMGYLGNVYDDLLDDFSADLSFSAGPVGTDGTVPLRPALGIGVGIVNLDKERVVLGGLLGVSPEGISVASLRIAYDLRDARPLFR